MTLPLPYPAPPETSPLVVEDLPGGIRAFAGCDERVLAVIAAQTGQEIVNGHSLALIRDDGASLLLAMHNLTCVSGASWIEVVSLPGGLPLSRAILERLATAAWDFARVRHIVVRVPIVNLELRGLLDRLGFKRRDTINDWHLYAVTPADLPPLFARARARRRH